MCKASPLIFSPPTSSSTENLLTRYLAVPLTHNSSQDDFVTSNVLPSPLGVAEWQAFDNPIYSKSSLLERPLLTPCVECKLVELSTVFFCTVHKHDTVTVIGTVLWYFENTEYTFTKYND